MLRLFLVYMVIVLMYVSAQVTLPPPLVSRKISYRGENALLIQRAVRMYVPGHEETQTTVSTHLHALTLSTHSFSTPPSPFLPSHTHTYTHIHTHTHCQQLPSL